MRLAGSVESWSVDAAGWENVARLQHEWLGPLFLRADSAILAVGGCELGQGGGTIPNVDRLDLRRAEWTPLRSLAVDRYCAISIAFGRDRWALAGGLVLRGDGLPATDAVEIVDAASGAVERLPAMTFARAEPLVAVLNDGRLLVAGGYADEVARDVEVYSPSSGSWETRVPLPAPRAASAGPFEIDERYSLWIGGCDSFEHAQPVPALVLDRDAVVVREVNLRVARGSCVVELEPGTFLVAGGKASDGRVLATTEIVRISVRRSGV